MRLLVFFIFTLWPLLIEGRNGGNDTLVWYYQKLLNDLMKGYERTVRPAFNSTHAIAVHTSLFFTSFDSLDEQKQMLSLTGWLRLAWRDFQLSWNPRDYGQITQIEVPISQIWYPEVHMYNTKDPDSSSAHLLAMVLSDGLVVWPQIRNFNTECTIDLRDFPYDSHKCSIYLSSWAYEKKKLRLYTSPSNESACPALKGSDWSLSDCSEAHHDILYPTGQDTHDEYTIVVYSLTISRVTSLASHLFVAPSVILCLITPIIFVLPPASKAKMTLGIGILISDVLLLGELISFIPAAFTSVPLIGKYFLANIVLCCLSLAISACVVNMWGRGSTRVDGPPQFISSIVLGPIARWLFISADKLSESLENDPNDQKNDVRISMTPDTENLQQFPTDAASGSSRLREAQSYVRKIVKLQWHQLAIVVDRIFLIVYLIILIVMTLMFAKYM